MYDTCPKHQHVINEKSKQSLVFIEFCGKGSLICLALTQELQALSFILFEKLSKKLTSHNFDPEA